MNKLLCLIHISLNHSYMQKIKQDIQLRAVYKFHFLGISDLLVFQLQGNPEFLLLLSQFQG